MGYNWGLDAAANEAIGNAKTETRCYCFDAVQRPVHPSDLTNEPEPLLPEKRPELVQLKPPADPMPVVEPLGLT